MESRYDIASLEIARHMEDSNYSRLAHFVIAKYYKKAHKAFLIIQSITITLILTFLLSPIEDFMPGATITVLKIFASLIVALMSSFGAIQNFNDLSRQNHYIAQKYQTLWRNCKNWKTDYPDDSFTDDAVRAARDFRDRINEINRDSPQIPDWAYETASNYIDKGTDDFDVEDNLTENHLDSSLSSDNKNEQILNNEQSVKVKEANGNA